jgi:hypothetical protein
VLSCGSELLGSTIEYLRGVWAGSLHSMHHLAPNPQIAILKTQAQELEGGGGLPNKVLPILTPSSKVGLPWPARALCATLALVDLTQAQRGLCARELHHFLTYVLLSFPQDRTVPPLKHCKASWVPWEDSPAQPCMAISSHNIA